MKHPQFVGRLGHVKPAEKALKAFDPSSVVEAPKEEESANKDEDIDDLFGGDDDDGAGAKAAAEAAKAAAKKKEKPKAVAMSLVMLEVKPLDDTIDLDQVAKKIFAEIT